VGLDSITPALTIYLVMVFGAVFLLSQGLIVPAFGDNRRAEKRVRQRLADISSHAQRQAIRSLLRDKYLFTLSPFERKLESLPGMESLNRWMDQAGLHMPAYRLVLISAGFDSLAGDPLGGFTLEMDDVDRLTREMVSRAEQWCGGRLVSSLEGGYAPERLGEACVVHMRGLTSGEWGVGGGG